MSNFRDSAEQFLKGMGDGSARRGPTVLKLIKSKTAQRVKERNKATTALYESERLTDTRNKAFLESIRHGASSSTPSYPNIREIERYALDWAPLVSQSAAIKADILRRLGEEYEFERKNVPRLLGVLGADDEAVQAAFSEKTGQDLSAIFADGTRAVDRVRWAQSRLSSWFENLPAFWASFALTITSTLGPVVLSLPIVFLAFGPLVAVGVITAAGLLSTLTLIYLAESQQRAGLTLRGQGFNRMIEHYLGRTASGFLNMSLFAYCTLVLFTFCGGFLLALDDMIGGPVPLYFIGLCGFVLWYISPKNTGDGLIFAFMVAVLNVMIVVGFSLVFIIMTVTAVADASPINAQELSEVPLQLAIGAVLYAFAGHISVSNGAGMILSRTSNGRGFTRGAAAGMGMMTIIYVLFSGSVLAAMSAGAIPASAELLQTIRTELGATGTILALVFVILTLGFGSGNYAMAAFSVVTDAASKILAKPNGTTSGTVPRLIGLGAISIVMGLALATFLQGKIQLSALFGMVGGLMAPIVAGLFPVMLYLSCRVRGESVRSTVSGLLAKRGVAVIVACAFCAVFVSQAATPTYYPNWYRLASLAMLVWVGILAAMLVTQNRFRPGLVIQIIRSKDGWRPQDWKVFSAGNRVENPKMSWQTTRNGAFEPILPDTNPVRVLSAITVETTPPNLPNMDVFILDELSGKLSTPRIKVVEEGIHIVVEGGL